MMPRTPSTRNRTLFLSLTLLVLMLASAGSTAIGQGRQTIQATVGKRVETGWPLVSDGKQFVMLRRDGSLKKIDIDKARDVKTISKKFQPYSFDHCVTRLSEVYGDKYQVTKTRHFVIVHPRGKQTQWANLFEKVYTQFHSYFSAMGFQVQTPEFPLIAIVFNTRSEYDAYTVRKGVQPRRSIVGYYMPGNNRIVTYNQKLDGGKNTSTLIHEITHQVAFNSGVQNRYAQPPLWICEGLAVMFEAPGIRNRQQFPKIEQRIHTAHYRNFLKICENGKLKTTLRKILTGDDVFQSDTGNAYTTAWALTYYLSETRPADMTGYLHVLAKRKDFSGYSDRKRWSDFANRFGSDLDDLEHRMTEYFKRLN